MYDARKNFFLYLSETNRTYSNETWKIIEKESILDKFFDRTYFGTQSSLVREKDRQSSHPSACTHASPRLGRGFCFWSRMIVLSFGLEKYRVLGMSPEMRYGVTAMAATRKYFQPTRALSIRARFPLLLFPCLKTIRIVCT